MNLTIEQFREIITLHPTAEVSLTLMMSKSDNYFQLTLGVRWKDVWQYIERIEVPEKPNIVIHLPPEGSEICRYRFCEGGEEALIQQNYPEYVSKMCVTILSTMISEAIFTNRKTWEMLRRDKERQEKPETIMSCGNCGGMGWVKIIYPALSGEKMTEQLTDCPVCQGTGRVKVII